MSGLDFHESGVRIKKWMTMMDSMTDAELDETKQVAPNTMPHRPDSEQSFSPKILSAREANAPNESYMEGDEDEEGEYELEEDDLVAKDVEGDFTKLVRRRTTRKKRAKTVVLPTIVSTDSDIVTPE